MSINFFEKMKRKKKIEKSYQIIDEKIVFLEPNVNEIKGGRKRPRSSDDAALNVFRVSPGHDGRKLLKIVTFLIRTHIGDWCPWLKNNIFGDG